MNSKSQERYKKKIPIRIYIAIDYTKSTSKRFTILFKDDNNIQNEKVMDKSNITNTKDILKCKQCRNIKCEKRHKIE